MKHVATIIIFIAGIATGYLIARYEANKKIEDTAITNIMNSGLVIPHYLSQKNYSTIQSMSEINAASNLDVAIEFGGSNKEIEFTKSKTRVFNALYQLWEKSPPSYINEISEPETKKWTTDRHNTQMLFLKKFYEYCKENKELQCKDS